MKNKFLKYSLVVMSFILAINIISPSLAEASESQNSQINNPVTIKYDLVANPIDSDYPVTELFNEVNDIEPQALPLIVPLATLVIRAGVTYYVRTSSKRVLKLSAHAADQAVDRKITGKMLDEALSSGTKYVDILSNERISWAENGSGTAVLLKPNTDLIDTVYNQKGKKLKWIKNNWQYIGDFQ